MTKEFFKGVTNYRSYNFKNKTLNIANMNYYMLAKTASMFEYTNLPDNIPPERLEFLLQTNGYGYFVKYKDDYYVVVGGLGGELDAYYRPKNIIIANPYIPMNEVFDIEKDGVLIRNDDMLMGLLPMFNKHNTILAENDINMVIWGYNSRMTKLLSAPDDKTRESAEEYQNQIINGEISVLSDNAMFEGVKIHGDSSNVANQIKSMIEYNQYIKASMYNEIGVSSNFNMKRERLIESEIDQSEDSLFPYVYNMMRCRLSAINKINEKYGLDIKIKFGSIWHHKNIELTDHDIKDHLNPDEISLNDSADNVDVLSGTGHESAPDPESDNDIKLDQNNNIGENITLNFDELLEMAKDLIADEMYDILEVQGLSLEQINEVINKVRSFKIENGDLKSDETKSDEIKSDEINPDDKEEIKTEEIKTEKMVIDSEEDKD